MQMHGLAERPDITLLPVETEISEYAPVESALRSARSELPPLAGVIHCANGLHEAPISPQDWKGVWEIIAPAVDGAWHLHTLTREDVLDLFVCFSPLVSLVDHPRDAAHSAASAFLDALVKARRAQGLCGLSVRWGPLKVGERLHTPVNEMKADAWRGIGLKPLAMDRALNALGQLVDAAAMQASVFEMDLTMAAAALGPHAPPPLLSRLMTSAPANEGTEIVQGSSRLREPVVPAPVADTEASLAAYISQTIGTLLKLPANDLPPTDAPLIFSGMDSLMFIELNRTFEKDLGVFLSEAELFLESPDYSIEDLARALKLKIQTGRFPPAPTLSTAAH
jgi:hypothetical protein